MGGNKVEYKVPDGVKALAEHLRDVAATDGKVDDGMVEWNEYVLVEEPVRNAVVESLKDLYIDRFEVIGIMEKTTKGNRKFVSDLVTNLRNDPPLFRRLDVIRKDCDNLSLFCNDETIPIQFRVALQMAAEDPNFRVSEKAKELLSFMLFAKLDE